VEKLTKEVKMESIKSFKSTVVKLENALNQMTQKGANTTLVKKRLNSCYIGLVVLENDWNQKPHHYTQKELAAARIVLIGLYPSIKNSYTKLKTGVSPQKTLLEKRIKAFELAVQVIEGRSNK
jgi:hypothetical protein